jgi:hypothetical protein
MKAVRLLALAVPSEKALARSSPKRGARFGRPRKLSVHQEQLARRFVLVTHDPSLTTQLSLKEALEERRDLVARALFLQPSFCANSPDAAFAIAGPAPHFPLPGSSDGSPPY